MAGKYDECLAKFIGCCFVEFTFSLANYLLTNDCGIEIQIIAMHKMCNGMQINVPIANVANEDVNLIQLKVE